MRVPPLAGVELSHDEVLRVPDPEPDLLRSLQICQPGASPSRKYGRLAVLKEPTVEYTGNT
jgi:hypothetical protein